MAQPSLVNAIYRLRQPHRVTLNSKRDNALASHNKTKEWRVFKFCFSADRIRSFKRELTLFRLIRDALGDRNDIARLYDVSLESPPYMLESQYEAGGTLLDWSKKNGGIGKLTPADRIELLAKVADAVAAAHSVGVLHKDIKPSNILVRERNAKLLPVLADFGIGILTDRTRLEDLKITQAGFTNSLLTDNESSRTGTRMYSPPESTAGKAFTTAGDVYALGVMLYQFTAGDLERPIGEGWQRDVSDELLRQDIAAAVDGDPLHRLSGAAALAHQLRTLEVRRAENARLAAVLHAVEVEKANAEQARVESARVLAEARFQDTWELARKILFQMDDAIANLPGATKARRMLVDTALHYLDRLSRTASNNPNVQHDLAKAYEKVGNILGNPYGPNVGDISGSLENYGKSLAIRVALVEADPSDPEAQLELAISQWTVGTTHLAMGQMEEALEAYQKVLKTGQGLAALGYSQAVLHWGHGGLGDVQLAMGRASEALESYSITLEVCGKLSATDPGLIVSLQELCGTSYYRMAKAHWKLGHLDDALDYFTNAFDISNMRLAADSGNTQARRDMAIHHSYLGRVYRDMGCVADALEHLQICLEVSGKMAAADPANVDAQNVLADAHMNIADLFASIGRREPSPVVERRRAWESAREHFRAAGEMLAKMRANNTALPLKWGQVTVEEHIRRTQECEQAIAELTAAGTIL